MVSYNLFYSFAYTIFNMSHGLMVPLSTRNTTDRGNLSVFNQIATIMMSGILVVLVFPMVIMPMLGVDREKWIMTMSLLAVIALIAFFSQGKSATAKELAFAGVCVATSFTLAILKVSPILYGGSITLASFVPIMIYAYAFGPTKGFIIGLIHGLLNFIEDPYILTPATFVFDYLLAFMSVGVMGFFGKMQRKKEEVTPLVLGCISVFSLRFLAHLLSGMIFFLQDAVWVSLPDWAMGNAFAYSFIYQLVYVPVDAFIATMVLVFLAKSGVLEKLTKLMKGR
jgi:energy-coupled thiamine transporter ThiT